MNKISIIIPVLNEEFSIGKLLKYLLANSSEKNISEIILVDGGSTDKSEDIIISFLERNNNCIEKYQSAKNNVRTLIRFIKSEKGRAKQMNLGAKSATGNILYFLHADSYPPNQFDELIIQEVKKGNNAGCFKMQFDSNHWWLKLASWFTQFNWRICRGGDQSQFITKELFNEIGGFQEDYIIYEDNILINELYARNQFIVINKNLKSSARMYRKHGIFKLQYFYWTIYAKRLFGADADDISSYYKRYVS
ncbi:MAG: glycosyltransferase family 2 protein [Flaviramulus sp.]|nr:TIGR04283 family arsenosugar biosynthesis glycosyltransferase [Flaviramulus sp.]NNC50977.1 glycosyltransferase family 2 protein [Flaviramulus sp.]